MKLKNRTVVNSNQKCIVVFFDIFCFGELVTNCSLYGKNYDDIVKSLLDIWDWINKKLIKGKNVFPYLFSDCGFLVYPLTSNNNDNDNILSECIGDVEILLLQYLEKGYFLRGGISCSQLSYTDNLFIGDAVLESVRIESKCCPGPFIILPKRELSKIISTKGFIHEYKISSINLKGQEGKMSCCVIFPPDKIQYIKLIKYYADLFADKGPHKHARVWDDIYKLLIDEFPNEFNQKEREYDAFKK